MSLLLPRRSCTIGSSINTRSEFHGEESVPALDIPVSKIVLSREEFGDLLLDPKAHKSLYQYRKNQPDLPRWYQVLAPLLLKGKINADLVELGLGRRTLKLREVKLARVRLDRQEGGTTHMSCMIQCTPTLDDTIEQLLQRLNQEVPISIEAEQYGQQPDMLDTPDEQDSDEADENADQDHDEQGRPVMGEVAARGRRGRRNADED